MFYSLVNSGVRCREYISILIMIVDTAFKDNLCTFYIHIYFLDLILLYNKHITKNKIINPRKYEQMCEAHLLYFIFLKGEVKQKSSRLQNSETKKRRNG